MKPYILGATFARGGSKGLPGKNIRLLAGRPLIAHAIAKGLACPLIDRLIVSTDDPEIARVALEQGAEVPFMRPAELARDDSPEMLAWRHAVRTLDERGGSPPIDIMVSLPATAPLNPVEDVEACLRALLGSDADLAIVVRPAAKSPFFGMVVLDDQGFASKLSLGGRPITRRQDAPAMYEIVPAAYAVRADYLMRATSLFEGRVIAVQTVSPHSVDIDGALDLEYAEFLMERRARGALD